MFLFVGEAVFRKRDFLIFILWESSRGGSKKALKTNHLHIIQVCFTNLGLIYEIYHMLPDRE